MKVISSAILILLFNKVLAAEPSQKPCNLPTHNCLEPCLLATCFAFMQATCRNYQCGQTCIAEFWLNGQEVTSQCDSSAGGPNMNPNVGSGLPQLNLDGLLGPSNPSTGGATNPMCPANQIAQCDPPPCRVSSCFNYPSAICRDDNCGGCFARFYSNGQEVTSLCRQQQQPQGYGQNIPWWLLLMREY